DVSEGLSAVVMRALERDLDARWPSALAMQQALEEVVLRGRTDLAETDVGAFLRELVEPTVEQPVAPAPVPFERSFSSLAIDADVSAIGVEQVPPTTPGRNHVPLAVSDTPPGTVTDAHAPGPDAARIEGGFALARQRRTDGTPE